MTTVPFDTLALARDLEAAGFPSKQAQDTAAALARAVGDHDVATKTDLRDLEQRLTIRMGGMLVALAGFLAIIRFFA